MVGTKEVSESRGSFDGPPVDPGYLARFAQAHEAAGFDRVLIGYHATGPDGFAVASHVLNATTRLKVLIAHRPGFAAPTLVARKLATLDQLTGGGRVAIHHITGGDELDQKRDGDFADHDRRYARTAEFMGLLRRELTAAEPFDHDGEFYRVRGAFSYVKPATADGIPLYFGGASPAAISVGAEPAIYLGVAAAARDWLAGFLGERTPSALGRPLATLPRFQAAAGEIETALAGADDLVNALARGVDAGDETVAGRPAMAKLIATRAAIGAVEQAVALVGNNALTRKNPLERHYRDVLCARVHTPQDDTILAAAGRAALAAHRRNPTTTTGAR